MIKTEYKRHMENHAVCLGSPKEPFILQQGIEKTALREALEVHPGGKSRFQRARDGWGKGSSGLQEHRGEKMYGPFREQ